MVTKKSEKELLRQRAEKLLPKKFKNMPETQDKETKALIHELQVHQIELEMQNEELRKAQSEIEESRTKYADLYDFAPSGYFTFNRAGEILEVNLTGASLLGVDRSLLLHRPFPVFVDPEFQSLFHNHRLSVLKNEKRERCELKLIKKDGKSFYASLESFLTYQGRNHRIRSVISDISELKKAQEKAEIEHAFRIAIENSILSGIAAVDVKGRQSYVNLGFCRMVGRSEEELVGREPPFAYWPPEELDHINNAFQTMIDGKHPRDGIQLRLMRKNGERFDALVIFSQLKDHKGNIIGWIGTFGDITHLKQMEKELKELNTQLEDRVHQRTAELEASNKQLKQEIAERKKMEEALKASEEHARDQATRLQAVLDTTPAIIWIAPDRECRQITGNRASHAFLRVPEGTDMSKSGPAPERLVHYRVFKDGAELMAPEMPIQQVAASGQGLSDYAMEIVFDDGSVRSVLGNINPVLNSEGNPNGAVAAFLDVTVRKRMEENLRQSEEKFRIFAENTRDMEAWVNPEGKFVSISPSSKKITGHDPGEFMENPKLWDSIIHPEDFPIFNRHRQEKERFPQEISFRIIHADGSIRWIGHVCQRVFNEEGRFLGIRSSNRDITERKQMEEELRESRDELEIRVQERTRELREQSKVLDSFFKFSTTPFVILDKDFNFIRVNEAYAKACHREVSEFIGHNHFEFYPSNAKAKFEQVVQTKKPYAASAKPFNFPDHPEWGTTYWDWTLTPVLDDTGEVEYLVFSLEDVTKRKQTEEAIKEERQRFNDVLEILPAYLILLAPDYHVPFANRFFRERFGESHGKRCFEYLFGRSEPCEICETYSVLKTMAPHHWEWTGPDSRIYDVSDFPFSDADGSTLILEMGIDITERKQAEKALQRHMQMLDLANDSIVIFDLDDRIIYWNKGAERLYGWKREEALGQQIHMLLRTVYPVPLADIKESLYGREHMEIELIHTKKDGTKVSTESRWTLQQDETGRAIAFLEINNDITERKRMEEELRAISLYARGLIEASPDPLITISTNGKVMDVNKATELATGVSRKDLIGSNFSDYSSEPDRAKKGYEKVFSEGFVKDYPLVIRHTSGHLTDVLYNATVYRNEAGEVQGVFAAARDITEYKRAEEALRESENRLRSLSSQLLSVQENERRRISREIHDSLGQSLSAIKFKIENITHQMHESSYKEMLEPLLPIIQESIEESRRIQMDLRPSILDDLGIIATLTWFTREFQKIYSSIRVDKEIEIIENEVPDTLKTVIYRISQEALNNIAKHSQADSVCLSLRKAAGLIELTIKDNGKGFDMERTLPANGPRKGLGLTSMRERAELSGGSFVMESTLGKGTIIRASWPT